MVDQLGPDAESDEDEIGDELSEDTEDYSGSESSENESDSEN